MRIVAPLLWSGCCVLVLVLVGCDADESEAPLRIAAWNLEHLNDSGEEGCIPREQADYDAIARRVQELGADIVAFQEVENVAAARHVFPESDWSVEVSARPDRGSGPECWDRPGAYLSHLATGFAIRKGIAYRRNGDLAALGSPPRPGQRTSQRWGTDITVAAGGRELRLLSVHLASGCWSSVQDRDVERAETCKALREQVVALKAWGDARRAEGTAFVILGDFNRRLAISGDWAWAILSPPAAPLHLATGDMASQCDPRFTEFIDHLVLGGAAPEMLVPGSVYELPKHGPHPDHCAVSADFAL